MTSPEDLDKIINRLADITRKPDRTAAELAEYRRLHRQVTTEMSSQFPTPTAARHAAAAAIAAAAFPPLRGLGGQGALDF